ncbi:MAG: hypothetical protein OSA42_07175 [Porticoccaceae bacterium]|nr:hypothetical protein [Porticoccaceae bacterium]
MLVTGLRNIALATTDIVNIIPMSVIPLIATISFGHNGSIASKEAGYHRNMDTTNSDATGDNSGIDIFL